MRPWFLLAFVAACQTVPVVQPSPAPPVAAGCVLEYGLQVSQSGEWIVATATVTNHDTAPHPVQMADRCPGQDVRLLGLPAGYDPDETCTMGACVVDDEQGWSQVGVPPGETVKLAAWSISSATSTCNGPLPAGTYELAFDPTAITAEVTACGPAAATVVVEDAPATPPTPTVRCEPMPACGIGCPGPMAKDENGCTLCACEKDPMDSLRP